MEWQLLVEWITKVITFRLVRLGEVDITLWTAIYVIILLVLLIYLSGKLKKWIVGRLMVRGRFEVGFLQATGAIFRYVIVLLGFIIILQSTGIDLTALNVFTGAVGIGVGFGLQNIVSNFISGLIILFERPIKIGDRIEVEGIEGDVVEISARSTTVRTNDNIEIIIPNSKFIQENVVNWSHTERKVRFKIPVTVAFGSDVRMVEKLLLEVADKNPDVLKIPAPGVRIVGFGEMGVDFELLVWSTSLMHRKGLLVSSVNFGIYESFIENGIRFPYPRRDMFMKGGRLEVVELPPQHE